MCVKAMSYYCASWMERDECLACGRKIRTEEAGERGLVVGTKYVPTCFRLAPVESLQTIRSQQAGLVKLRPS